MHRVTASVVRPSCAGGPHLRTGSDALGKAFSFYDHQPAALQEGVAGERHNQRLGDADAVARLV